MELEEEREARIARLQALGILVIEHHISELRDKMQKFLVQDPHLSRTSWVILHDMLNTLEKLK